MLVRVILLKQNFNFANSPLHMYVSLKHIHVLSLSLFHSLSSSLAFLVFLDASATAWAAFGLAWLGACLKHIKRNILRQSHTPFASFSASWPLHPAPLYEQKADRHPRQAQGTGHKAQKQHKFLVK